MMRYYHRGSYMQKHNGSVISDGMDSVLVRYHEIALKKGNRAYFTELLKKNLLAAVKGFFVVASTWA